MPDISSAATYTKSTVGLSLLKPSVGTKPRLIAFTGTSIGTDCTIEMLNDAGDWVDIPNNVVTSVPTTVTAMTNRELRLVFTGSPNCNVSIEYLEHV